MKLTRLSVSLVVAVALGALTLTSTGAAAREDALHGTQANMLTGTGLTVSSSDWFYVIHGMRLDDWSGRTADERRAFLDDDVFRFELALDGAPVALHRVVHMEGSPDGYQTKRFYVQFKPGDFAPGSYALVGTWWTDWDGNGVPSADPVRTQTLVVTP